MFMRICMVGLFCILSPCQGNINPPSGQNYSFENGLNEVIEWTYTFNQSDVFLRTWYFSYGVGPEEQLASVALDKNAVISDNTRLPHFNVRKPGTLLLQSVDEKYNGMYRFEVVLTSTKRVSSKVNVIVLVRPTAVTNCSNMEVNEGDEIRCLCEGKHGNPPASVSWIKDNVTVAGPESLRVLLVENAGINDGGTYICEAKTVSPSLTLGRNVSIQVTVKPHRRPTALSISVTPPSVVLGVRVTLTCEADAHPAAQLHIAFNGKNVSYDGTYVIESVGSEDLGTYQCIATNRLGSNSVNRVISVGEKATTSPTTQVNVETSSSNTASVGHVKKKTSLAPALIAVIVIVVVLVLVVIVVLVWWFTCKCKCKCKCKDREDGPGRRHNVTPGGYEEPKGENQYATADEAKRTNGEPSGTLPSTSGNRDAPPVYAAVDKSKKTKKPAAPTVQYASLDPVDLQPDSSMMRDRGPPQETSYAAIDFGPLKADLV